MASLLSTLPNKLTHFFALLALTLMLRINLEQEASAHGRGEASELQTNLKRQRDLDCPHKLCLGQS